jgi:hypothetical protein
MSDNGAEQHRFTRTALFICGGLLIWAVHFLFVYVAAAIICARYAGATLGGIPFVTFLTGSATVLACAAALILIWFALRRARADSDTDASVRFIYFLTSAIGALALVAIVFSAIPGLLLATECGTHAASSSGRLTVDS